MGNLTRTARRVLRSAVLALAGTAILVTAGAGIASARPASSTACQKINATLSSLVAILKAHPASLKSAVAQVDSQLTQAASTASPAVKSAVSTFVADLEANAAAGKLDVSKDLAAGDAILAACSAQSTAPSGAPATGGGSAVGVQDPVLFGLGGATVLAGIAVLGLARRRWPRGSPGQV
jgi:hypothetical protein